MGGPEDEFKQFKDDLYEFLELEEDIPKNRIILKHENTIDDNALFDILVLDYGGMSSIGSDTIVDYQISQFVRLLKDNPSKYFILGGYGLQYALQDEVENTIQVDPKESHNLYVQGFGETEVDSVIKALKELMGI